MKVKVLVTQSYPTVCNPMYCNLPGSSVHGILQARILELVVIPFSRGSSQPRDQTLFSCNGGGIFTVLATGGEKLFGLQIYFSIEVSLGLSEDSKVCCPALFTVWTTWTKNQFAVKTISFSGFSGHFQCISHNFSLLITS